MNIFKFLAAVLFAVCLSLTLISPGYQDSTLVGVLLPAGVFMLVLANGAETRRKHRARELEQQRDKEAVKQAELKRRLELDQSRLKAESLGLTAGRDFDRKAAEFDHLGKLFQDGMITRDQLREKWAELNGLLPDTAMRHVPGLTDHRTPVEQLKAVSEQYGLPVNVSPPVSGGGNPFGSGGPIKHVCDGPNGHRRYFQDVSFCPEHRGLALVYEELGKESWAPQVSADTYDPPETRPGDLVPSLEELAYQTAIEDIESYVPAGQDELLENLRKNLLAQWTAAEDRRQDRPRTGHWEMSGAWAQDVRKLRKLGGGPVWKTGSDMLYGYPVKIDAAYGAPELKEI